MYFHNFATSPNPLQSPLRKAVTNKSKFSLALLCNRTVISQRQFGGQNRVPREIGTKAQTVKESQPETSSCNGWFRSQENHFFITGPTG